MRKCDLLGRAEIRMGKRKRSEETGTENNDAGKLTKKAKISKKKGGKGSRKPMKGKKVPAKCWACGGTDHTKRDCPVGGKPEQVSKKQCLGCRKVAKGIVWLDSVLLVCWVLGADAVPLRACGLASLFVAVVLLSFVAWVDPGVQNFRSGMCCGTAPR